jgi:hypothetical protein
MNYSMMNLLIAFNHFLHIIFLCLVVLTFLIKDNTPAKLWAFSAGVWSIAAWIL